MYFRRILLDIKCMSDSQATHVRLPGESCPSPGRFRISHKNRYSPSAFNFTAEYLTLFEADTEVLMINIHFLCP